MRSSRVLRSPPALPSCCCSVISPAAYCLRCAVAACSRPCRCRLRSRLRTICRLCCLSWLPSSEAHWEILNLLRAFYAQFQLSPANRALVRYVAQQLGPDKGNSLYLNRLFKGTPAKLAAKLAGLPKPSNCL